MTEPKMILKTLARDGRACAELLRDAVCDGCRTCVSEISDINRRALLELSEYERLVLMKKEPSVALGGVQALCECISLAFSAAMLIGEGLPYLPPLASAVTTNASLAAYPEQILEDPRAVRPFSWHACANKGRGEQALLLTNFCSAETGARLYPLVFSLETHRNALERTCGVLVGSVTAIE